MFQDFPFLNRWITSFGSGRPFWTLAIEWWAYIVFGYVVLVIIRDWRKASIKLHSIVILCILSFEPILKMVGGRGNGLMLTWLLGVAIYLIYDKLLLEVKQIKFIQALTIFSFLTTGLIALWVKDAYNTSFVFSLSISILFFLIWGNTKESSHELKLLTLLSCYMYSLYLVHYSIVEIIFRSDIALNSTLKILVSIILSNIVAILFYRIFEKSSKPLAKVLQKWVNTVSSRFSVH
jgi:peptidoglycan/LPS O-acetylase OafA/YrhL